MTLFGKITFFPTLGYNYFLSKLSFRRWYDRIDEVVILGALPWKLISEDLIKKENVRGVVSMNMDYELYYAVADKNFWNKHGVQFLQLNTPDIFHAPSLQKLIDGVKFINEVSKNNNCVFVHCKAGRTRSTTLVACYLISKYNFSPSEAIDFIKKKRPQVLLHSKQRTAIELYYKTINKV